MKTIKLGDKVRIINKDNSYYKKRGKIGLITDSTEHPYLVEFRNWFGDTYAALWANESDLEILTKN